MIEIHSRFIYQGEEKFGGTLKPGMEVLHVASNTDSRREQVGELVSFVVDNGLPKSLLTSPHLYHKMLPHLDAWGWVAEKIADILG